MRSGSPRPTGRIKAPTGEQTLRPGGKSWEGHFRQKEQPMLGPELQQSLGTTAILSGPRANWEPCNQWRREDPLGRGLECRGQPPASLLRRAAAGLGPSAPPHPHPRLLPASGRPGKAGPAAALSSRSPGGSEPAGSGARLLRLHQSPPPRPIRLRKGRASREGGRFGRIPLSSR